MEADSGLILKKLRVDGGAVVNNFLMQFQADILGTRVERPVIKETTALGAAYLAGLAVKYWQNKEVLKPKYCSNGVFKPEMSQEKREECYTGWKKAVKRAKGWIEE
jgi:glycerol kinase